MKKYNVYIGKVPGGYENIAGISDIIDNGLESLGLYRKITGKVVLKPNLVMVDYHVAKSCFTRPEIVHAFLRVSLGRFNSLHIVENSGRGVPTYRMMKKVRHLCKKYLKGYYSLEDLYPGKVKCSPIDEEKLYNFQLEQGELLTPEEKQNPALCSDDTRRFYNQITTSAHYADCDCIVYMPKLKSNVLGNGLTGALKLGGIGNIIDSYRMNGHNDHNSRRIADMLEIAFPDLIITDAIEASVGGNQMTQAGKYLGAVIIADNPVAHDMVAAHLLHLDYRNLRDVMMAVNRGYGPSNMEEIEISGDFSVDEIREITGDWDLGVVHISRIPEKIKKEQNIEFKPEIISGEPYSIPGDQGVFLDWFYTTYDYEPTRKKISSWPEMSIMVGKSSEIPRFSKVILVGNKAIESWKQMVISRKGISFPRWVQSYLGFPERIERYTLQDRKGWAFYIAGDPPSHKNMIFSFFIASFGKMRSSLFKPTLIADTYLFSLRQIFLKWWNNRKGIHNHKPRKRIISNPGE